MQIVYGPDRDGEFHPLAVAALEYAGAWLDTNGPAIYATRSLPRWSDMTTPEVRYTRTKDNSTIFATYLSFDFGRFAQESHTLGCLGGNVTDVALLGYTAPDTRKEIPIGFKTGPAGVIVMVPLGDLAALRQLPAPAYSFRIRGAVWSEERC